MPAYKQLYNDADKLSNTAHPSDKTDAEALGNFFKVIAILEKSGADNAFLLKTYVTTGVYLQVLSRDKEAIITFKKALNLKSKLPALKDSVLFEPLVYCGNSNYRFDKLDSAEYFYRKAEVIAEKYPAVNQVERLYNTLGVIAYATGNYNKSITYYEKAASTLQGHATPDKLLLVTYKNNLALAYRRLKRYPEALAIYKTLLPYNIEKDKLLHNIGSVYLAMGQSGLAIGYLKQVHYQNVKLYNDLGRSSYMQNDYGQALNYLMQAAALNTKTSGNHKRTDYSITLKYTGDIWLQKQEPGKALTFYQQAFENLLFDFNTPDIYTNPADFNSAFNTVELMDALLAKAAAFNMLYEKSASVKNLDAALQTYTAFYKLADHVARFYETDEARLVISDKKYASHLQPIDICLQLYGLTKDRKYMEQAFVFDEENKANTLSIYLEESKLKAHSGVPAALLTQESRLKENITRTSLKAAGMTDSVSLIKLKTSINDDAIRLIKVQQKIEAQTGLSSNKFSRQIISIQALQQVIPKNSAVLSYHTSDKSILCFVVTANSFDFFLTPITRDFPASITAIYQQAQLRDGGNNRHLKTTAQYLYRQLLQPATVYLDGVKQLVIIPDDQLNYLPFEILTNDKGENLLNNYSIAYNYSCAILKNGSGNITTTSGSRLGMAPFDVKANAEWAQLPASAQEIKALGGTELFGTKATKQAFVTDAHNYGLVHLATHAYANDRKPDSSFIVFYPGTQSAINYKLYQPEIYNLKLDKTRLVVLSACESGVGELVKGEGLMSLSRAFSYAGCDNIITSMWKADDLSTAYISGRLHSYLQNGYTITEALRQARLDYLDDDAISPAKKTPGYWAHLRLIGGFEKPAQSYAWLIWLLAIFSAGIIIAITIKNRDRIRRPRS
ncbi:CHAT domain-containing protein [Mucilaginibacter flavidus]|uniref:CHAT domain-containing protein n=1 Tax=Mucilaginibacter flavidus TaxID=2949309 RepID=UPI002092107D|nr:CHAT domain-containing protein [Mucilaginibacter flavidus]MCO5947367.1 CHAT domain-containing protein [Mucilaginibacter flavidus]